jgi:hypothetical protein
MASRKLRGLFGTQGFPLAVRNLPHSAKAAALMSTGLHGPVRRGPENGPDNSGTILPCVDADRKALGLFPWHHPQVAVSRSTFFSQNS